VQGISDAGAKPKTIIYSRSSFFEVAEDGLDEEIEFVGLK
jgi:hypothetical protein